RLLRSRGGVLGYWHVPIERVDCAIDRFTPRASHGPRAVSVNAEDSAPYACRIFSTNWILATLRTVGLVGQRRGNRRAHAARATALFLLLSVRCVSAADCFGSG